MMFAVSNNTAGTRGKSRLCWRQGWEGTALGWSSAAWKDTGNLPASDKAVFQQYLLLYFPAVQS